MLVAAKQSRYAQIIETIFTDNYREGMTQIDFVREDIPLVAERLGITLPKNLGDVIYSMKYRTALPTTVIETERDGLHWAIRSTGRSKYRLILGPPAMIRPTELLSETKVPDSTPGLISMYAQGDEQALLARLRYNRLIDIFTGITCYSLQNHLRTYVADFGQVETDELYVGVDRRGAHYVIPVQAKGGTDTLNVVQIEQDMALCREKFPSLICKLIAAQFMDKDLIALFEFEESDTGASLIRERHYRLMPPAKMSPEDLAVYRARTDD